MCRGTSRNIALDFEEAEGATPVLNKDWPWEEAQ